MQFHWVATVVTYTGPAFSGKGSGIHIEEVVLACEGIDLLAET